MPFGLQGAPATFQRMMDKLLGGCRSFATAYLDDLIIFIKTWEEHMQHLTVILKWIQEAGLTVKPKKCNFGAKYCSYLGHIVGRGEVHMEISKLKAVQNFPIPTTKKEVRAYLGITRSFIPQFASIAAALTDLTRKSSPNKINWTPACDFAFSKLKQLLCAAPVLCLPDFEKQFILQTDASDRGVGAVLS